MNRSAAGLKILSSSDQGHRSSYISVVEKWAEENSLTFSSDQLSWLHIFSRDVLLSLMLEEETSLFLIVAGIRALLGRRSVALLFRPGELLNARRLRHKFKVTALRIARQSKGVKILTILPFIVEPKFEEIACGWIFDPQLWDVFYVPQGNDRRLAASVEGKAAGRKIVLAAGFQNEGKGFHAFVDLWCNNADIRKELLFVSAGKVAPLSGHFAQRFQNAGGLLIDRFIEDDEFLPLYETACAVWCCYSPSYDQASGIFGRSVQVGALSIVRDGSYNCRMAEIYGVPFLAIDWSNPQKAAPAFLACLKKKRAPFAASYALSLEMQHTSFANLYRAIGFGQANK